MGRNTEKTEENKKDSRRRRSNQSKSCIMCWVALPLLLQLFYDAE